LAEERSVDSCYQYNKDTRSYVEAVEKRHGEEIKGIGSRFDTELKDIRTDLKALVEKMSNRVAPWLMFYVSFLTLLVGGLLAKVVFR